MPDSVGPSGFFSTVALTSTAQGVGTAATRIVVDWGVIVGGAASHSVIFRISSAGATYFTIRAPIGGVIPLRGFVCPSGLEVITGDAAADVTVMLAYRVRT